MKTKLSIERIIGTYSGQSHGPLVLVTACMHGNEHAGYEALDTLFTLLRFEHQLNSSFQFSGKLVGLLGNRAAFLQKKRFLERDMNRMWDLEHVHSVMNAMPYTLQNEDAEMWGLLTAIRNQVLEYLPSRVIMMDLHTTTADGGIFAVVRDEAESIELASAMGVPVVTGMLSGLSGTTLHYFESNILGVDTTAVAFEAGSHEDPLSANRCIAAIINCLRTVGCVQAADVENKHDSLLQEYARNLPKVVKLAYRHGILPGDNFCMMPGFVNFQPIHCGQLLAYDRHGEIRARCDGLILMPLYQSQGDDGFFIVQEVNQPL